MAGRVGSRLRAQEWKTVSRLEPEHGDAPLMFTLTEYLSEDALVAGSIREFAYPRLAKVKSNWCAVKLNDMLAHELLELLW